MRSGTCTLQQALTSEAANVVKQAVNLARRRGHVQVTPLHVANAMLSSPTGILRTACLQSHSHPLQCKALELCFNVALNRLPTSTSSPMLGHHGHHPTLSNALVAAFKRAQAHQRRGCIENQQQPLLAVKVELEQLIVSILDDPSVSRVMREAGFLSTQVKNNVEKVISLEISTSNLPNKSVSNMTSSLSFGQLGVKLNTNVPSETVSDEDVVSVMENLMKKKRSTVIVGESLASSEGVVRALMAKFEKGEIPDALRNLQLISLPPFSFSHLSREDVEDKLGELRCLLKNCIGRWIVLYLGDLKWVAEFRANSSESGRSYYTPVDHMIMEIGMLVRCVKESCRFSLMGIATYQTYMRCKVGRPSLETVWDLHPLSIPEESLVLSLTSESDRSSHSRIGGIQSVDIGNTDKEFSGLPSWLQQYKADNRKKMNTHDEECFEVGDACRKWGSSYNPIQNYRNSPEKIINFSVISPASSSHERHFYKANYSPITLHLDENFESGFRMHKPDNTEKRESQLTRTLSLSSSTNVLKIEYESKFNEVNSENLNILSCTVEKIIPWQKTMVMEIASTILQCRSGMTKRRGKLKFNDCKKDTWLFFQGGDSDTKENIARALANLIFGSSNNLISIGLSSFSSKVDGSDDLRNKRLRDESSCNYFERFSEAMKNNPHCVFFLDDMEHVDYYSKLGIKSAIEKGSINNASLEDILLEDAIVILSTEGLETRSRASSPTSVPQNTEIKEEISCENDEGSNPCILLDLNISADEDETDNLFFEDTRLFQLVDGRFLFKSQGTKNDQNLNGDTV